MSRGLAGIPRMAVICAAVASVNALGWSLVTPPFQVPDEPDHFAYVKQLAETGRPPSSSSMELPQEELTALYALHYEKLRERPQVHTIATREEQERLERMLASSGHQRGSPGAGLATSEPPLYYALEAVPYSLQRHGNVLERLLVMRAFSALFAGLTALFVFMFVREALPATPWAWSVGGLSIALTPLLGFMSGAVNPDALLFAVSAALFYCLARAFRRGLSPRRAGAIAAVIAVGFATKLNFAGLAPGALLGLTVLTVRAARSQGRSAYRLLPIAAGVGLGPVLLYATLNILSNRPPLGRFSGALTATGSWLAQLNYIWQLYLPRLPGTVSDFPGLLTTRQIWFDHYVGLYGWLDTPLAGWAESLALLPAGAIALLCARSLYHSRSALRARALELATYAVMSLGLMALIGVAAYSRFPLSGPEFGQPRYLLPLLPLAGAFLAMAARGAGRRWGPSAGALILVLFLAHDVFSQLQVVARYYG